MIGLYGRGDKRTTAWRATLYLGLASMVLLAALLMIGTQAGFTFSGLQDFIQSGQPLENAELIGSIIKAHFEMGGTLINVNIMDKQKVLDAHKDPSKYPDLVVRVTGFTAYFSMLSPQFRQLVVDRILVS